MGVLLKTREAAVSLTAILAAVRDLPRECVEGSAVSFVVEVEVEDSFWFGDWGWVCFCFEGNTSIPTLISSPLITKTFKAPALATAANGINRPIVCRVPGENRLKRGTRALRPMATPQETLTARA